MTRTRPLLAESERLRAVELAPWPRRRPVIHPRDMDPREHAVGVVKIELVSQQHDVTTISVDEAVLRQSVLKIPAGNGYEHFALDGCQEREGRIVPVYRWVQRTKIAE